MYFLYNSLWVLAFVVLSPVVLVGALLDWRGFRQRLGWGSAQSTEGHPVWVHAASMGEVQAAAAILFRLKRQMPDLPIVISTTSLTGYRRANDLLGDLVEQVFLAPLDFSLITRHVFRRLSPRALLLVETEIWPNLIREASQIGCRIALVNGRLSSRHFPRYLRIRGVIAESVRQIELLCTQSEDDRRRFLAFDARPETLFVTGNVKVDVSETAVGKQKVRRTLKLPERCSVLVGGSTHEGEEEALLDSFRALRRFRKSLKLILAPRYLKRVDAVASLVRTMGYSVVRKSALEDQSETSSYDVLIVDTMGELGWIYGAGDVAFVGGSLVPVGGHNPFEPLCAGVPAVFGPHMNQEGAESMLAAGAALQIKEPEELTARLRKLLDSPERRRAMVDSGKALMKDREKSAEQTVALLIEKGIVTEIGPTKGTT
ncbi:MAG: 3-deoxy-D-manno-octulosonic acid transferase [Candidatus Latescibacterota bacterium]